MNIQFTKEEIKNSVEYQWRMFYIKYILIVWLIIAVFTLFAPILISLKTGFENLLLGLLIWLLCNLILGFIFGGFALYYYSKIKYLMKNYNSFKTYEVLLDKVATSFAYRGHIYYSVTLKDDNFKMTVDTNPYFSSYFSKFTIDDYNNKKVLGLYDSNLQKFYIIKLVK